MMDSSAYLEELLRERETLNPQSHAYRLVDQEIARLQPSDLNGAIPSNDDSQIVSKDRPGKAQWRSYEGAVVHEEVVKLSEKVFVPVKEFPKFNFVGKLLGPRGNTLKRLQAATQTRMSVLGRGSTRDKNKEEELRDSGDPKYEHLKDELHVLIEVEAPRSEAHARLAAALAEIKRYMVPENDEIRQEQMREMAMLKNMNHADEEPPQVPIGRGRGRGRGGAASTLIRGPHGGIPPGGAIIIHAPPPPGLIAAARVPRMMSVPRAGARVLPRHGVRAPEQHVRYDEYDATYDAAYEGYPETGEAPPVLYEFAGETVEYPAVSGVYPATTSIVRRPEKRFLSPMGPCQPFGGPGKRYRGPEVAGDVKYPALGESAFSSLGTGEEPDAYATTMH